MLQRPLVPLALFASAVIAIVAVAAALRSAPPAQALPPAGTDSLNVAGQVTVASRLGLETITLTGTATIQRGDPHLDEGIEVVDAEITALSLSGMSVGGAVNITESITQASAGEIRSLQPPPTQFPASSFFDVYIDVTIPSSPSEGLVLHNQTPMRLIAQGQIDSWPPGSIKFLLEPIFGVDNDGDTLIDEDTADEDGDGLIDEDRPGADPETPGAGYECGEDVDCDNQEGEDPPAEFCGDPSPPVCDSDGDGEVDEDPSCIPLLNSGNTHMKTGACVRTASIALGQAVTPPPTNTPCGDMCAPTPTRTLSPTPTATSSPPPPGPEDPAFSVAPGGPSGLHPADILGLSEGATPVFGNNNFANAQVITSLPFSADQNTFGSTVEPGEPISPADCLEVTTKGATVWFRYTPATSGTFTIDTFGSSFDTVLAVYTGSVLNTLTLVECDDDTDGLQSEVTLSGSAGVPYRIQAGGYNGIAGNLSVTVRTGGGGGGDGGNAGDAPFVRIPCRELGLTADGCDSGADGDQDDIDGLSFGADFGGGGDDVFFSVAPGSLGLSGSAVAAQAGCSPAQPQADEFASERDGNNDLVFDGDGAGVGCPPGPPLFLAEVPASDDLDALNEQSPDYVDTDLNGTPDLPVFFTLAPGSPSLAAQGRRAADILWTVGGAQPGVYASAATLGLVTADAIDGLCIADGGSTGVPAFNLQDDRVFFSLAPGSPSLGDIGAGAADLLSPGPQLAVARADLGLRPADDVDAMKCAGEGGGGEIIIGVGDIWFCGPFFSNGNVCETKINAGETVVWDFSNASVPHTTMDCGDDCDDPTDFPLWDSGTIGSGSPDRTFAFTFDDPGVYAYYCEIHPNLQLGRIVVNGAGGELGDVNCDGTVDAIDALLMLQLNASLLSSLGCEQNADVNGDGEIDAIDAAIVLQYVAGLINSLPP